MGGGRWQNLSPSRRYHQHKRPSEHLKFTQCSRSVYGPSKIYQKNVRCQWIVLNVNITQLSALASYCGWPRSSSGSRVRGVSLGCCCSAGVGRSRCELQHPAPPIPIARCNGCRNCSDGGDDTRWVQPHKIPQRPICLAVRVSSSISSPVGSPGCYCWVLAQARGGDGAIQRGVLRLIFPAGMEKAPCGFITCRVITCGVILGDNHAANSSQMSCMGYD